MIENKEPTTFVESRAYRQGYKEYYLGVSVPPYNYDTQRKSFNEWCDGHYVAYCEDEGK